MKIPINMRYITMRGSGGPEVMHIEIGLLPNPQVDEVLIKVMAAGVNRPDILQRQGKYPPPPNASPILGLEIAGEIIAKGQNVTGLTIGDRVCALTNGGGYAEYCVAPFTQCLPWPQGFDAILAAALPENYFTVWANVFQLGRLCKNESILVHGGSSGIGITTIQLAREFAGKAYVTAGSSEKCKACGELGATAAINYREKKFSEEILNLTADTGVNMVLDMVGAPYFADNLKCLMVDGRLIEISTIQGSVVEHFDLRQVMQKRIVITGSALRPRSTSEKAAIAEDLKNKVWPVLNAGRCRPVIYKTFPLSAAADAHRLMESSQHIGKIILQV